MHWLAKVENQYVTLIMITLQVILISGLIPNLPEDIERKCLRDGIKPDIVDVIPDFEIEVMFGDGVLVEFGNEINERECQEEPNVLWPFEKNTTHYTLIMTDPDYPTRSNASQREFQHWLIGNIPGTVEGNGEELTPWYPPHPIKFGGFHRYTFIVFMQPEGEKIKFDEPKLNDSVHGRAHFNTKKFAAKYNLGDPVAINYFRAESFYG
ncbi:unnamed protein product [Bemisia tabaci]|uniref:Phosphatidylethanolamine-binding protein n=1 Tax=Bemisia tabaci TaxID=7038 RepID=A0A9P0F417_BEMTA|nr:PREDICTED: protein D3-like isoform X2 [Bemisia tabaci]CAH0388821.1 unnamed protein product [Bemisia tabaci]